MEEVVRERGRQVEEFGEAGREVGRERVRSPGERERVRQASSSSERRPPGRLKEALCVWVPPGRAMVSRVAAS